MWGVVAYAMAIAAALGAVAMCLEHIADRYRHARRPLWAFAMLLSMLLPPALIWMTPADPGPVSAVAAPTAAPGGETYPSRNTLAGYAIEAAADEHGGATFAVVPAAPAKQRWQVPEISARSFLVAWGAVSAVLFMFLAAASLKLRRRATAWTTDSIHGHEVLVSEHTGPALIGALRPRIVVPQWFLAEPPATQLLILEHESQHRRARDPLLLRAGLVVAMAMPWNLPLWWQLQRLRLAIELDCDARVLRGGADAAGYAGVLLSVVRRAAAMPVGAVAMSEPVSALERRIRNLVAGPRRYAVPGLAGASVLAIAGVGVMVTLRVPAIPETVPYAVVAQATAGSDNRSPVAPASSMFIAPGEEALAANDAGRIDSPVENGAVSTPAARPRAAATPQIPRLPPPAVNAPHERVMRALVERYPEIVTGPEQPGVVQAAIVLRADGTVYRSEFQKPRPEAPNGSVEDLSDAIPRGMGIATTAFLKAGTAVPGGVLQSTVALRYLVLPEGYDAARSAERVQAALVAAHPHLLLPVLGDHVNRVTVYMTADGQVDQLYTELRHKEQLLPIGAIEPVQWAPLWEPLGLRPDQLGVIGLTYAYAGLANAEDRKWMIVRYAFPRREGEPLGGLTVAATAAAPQDTFDSAAALAIVERHLPDVFRSGEQGSGTPAIVLSGSGEVIMATRVPTRLGVSPEAVRALQEQAAPGVQLSRFVARPVRNAEGAGATVLFAWDVLTASR